MLIKNITIKVIIIKYSHKTKNLYLIEVVVELGVVAWKWLTEDCDDYIYQVVEFQVNIGHAYSQEGRTSNPLVKLKDGDDQDDDQNVEMVRVDVDTVAMDEVDVD